MNNDDHLLTLKIDAYIKGQLAEVERQAFEKDLQSDAALADRVRTQRAELVLLDMVAEEDLRLKVRKWSAQLDDNNNKTSRKWWQQPLSIFAFMSGIVALFFLLFYQKDISDAAVQVTPNIGKQDTLQVSPTISPTKSNPLPKIDTIKKIESPIQKAKPEIQNAKPPIAIVENPAIRKDLLAYAEDINRTAERGAPTNDPLSKSVQFIQNQDFIAARNTIAAISPQAAYYTDAQFLLATIDYLDKKPKAAATVFKTLSDTDGYLRKEQAVYYLAASLIADGQVDEGKKILTLIAADAEHPKHDAAVVLLKSL